MAEVLQNQQSGGIKPGGRRVNNRGAFRAEGVQGGFDPQNQNVTLSRKSEMAVKQKKEEQKSKKGGCCK